MNRSIKALAVAAPVLALAGWIVVDDAAPSQRAGVAVENVDRSRTRDLPADGPMPLADAPIEAMVPAHRIREIMPHLDPSLFDQARLARQ